MGRDDRSLRVNGNLARGEALSITVDGCAVEAYLGETVGAALWAVGIRRLRHRAKTGKACGIYCGIGVCFGCRVTIDGVPNVLACQTPVADGMKIETQEGQGQWKQAPTAIPSS